MRVLGVCWVCTSLLASAVAFAPMIVTVLSACAYVCVVRMVRVVRVSVWVLVRVRVRVCVCVCVCHILR